MKLPTLLLALALTTTAIAQPKPENAPPGGAQFKLIGNGREPRVAIRYSPPVGTVDRVEITSRIKQSSAANGFANPRSVDETIRYTLRAEVAKETPEGVEIALELVGVEGSLPADEDAKTKPDVSKAKGAKGTLSITRLGSVTGCTLTPPAGAPADAAKVTSEAVDCIQQLFMISLPADDVGAGALWSITESAGADQRYEMTFRVLAAAKDRFSVQGSADTPAQQLPADPGMKVSSSSQKGTITTEFVASAGHAMPVRSTFTMKHSAEVSGEARGQAVKLTMSSEQDVSLRTLQSSPPADKPKGK